MELGVGEVVVRRVTCKLTYVIGTTEIDGIIGRSDVNGAAIMTVSYSLTPEGVSRTH